jgi:hypothetical protein
MEVVNVTFFMRLFASSRDMVIKAMDVRLLSSCGRFLTTCEGEDRRKMSFLTEVDACSLIYSLHLLRDASKMKCCCGLSALLAQMVETSSRYLRKITIVRVGGVFQSL